MIIKFTLVGLIIVLIVVITASYYVNKEGFEDIFDGVKNDLDKTKKDLDKAVNTISSDVSFVGNGIIRDVPNPMGAASATPKRFDIKPEISLSPSGYDAMSLQQKSELLKDIQKVVRNEMLANRLTTPLTKNRGYYDETTSTEQGKEYEYNCHKDKKDDCSKEDNCSKKSEESCPDMSKYIKKDEIPCWGCKLDY
jgi:hypothetical protein